MLLTYTRLAFRRFARLLAGETAPVRGPLDSRRLASVFPLAQSVGTRRLASGRARQPQNYELVGLTRRSPLLISHFQLPGPPKAP